jgi:hypothetical protein
MSPSEEYDWQVSRYIPEDSPEQYSIDDLLHDLKMTKGTTRHPSRSLKQNVQAWEQTHNTQLTRAQQRILHTIGQELDYAYSVGIWRREQLPEEIEQLTALSTPDTSPWREDLALATKRYDALMLKAWRAGLSGHPLVIEWRLTYHSLGYRNILRRAKRGLERGTQAPSEVGEAKLIWEVLQRLASEESLRSIYRLLAEQKRIRTSWQAFHKWVKRHGLYPPPEPLWRIPQDVWTELAPIIEQYDPPRATERPRTD